ncbi:MAG: FkbM family methyltransferase [Microcystis aeruginosa LL13-06]|jgi:FkbM family methyltransferase|uniref:FkbM family methyltransferase n=1 Tax=Microcystis aeruginosa G11-04 TaxID=2685956 RepID=A0A966FW67_MICAE|nr:FkbM family methyltransferase [Microcystis aeruginosa SX13-11]NCR56539.1 FkbM family methyltransferase [Microcystis aeruginosa LL13-06]NCR66593.1 FkbM family methyltransferase [Microcystis aeruginosa LL11-07]NCS55799.1 FkbM family methyltransferase [Microcystis aeruginosa G11-04]
MINFEDFQTKIQKAIDVRDSRLEVLEGKKHKPLAIFGYGNKGKQISKQLRLAKQAVQIYDVNPNALESACSDGFDVVHQIDDLIDFQVILGSGQNQIEQKDMVFDNYIFYEEATFFYDLVHLQSRKRDMSNCIVHDLDRLYWVYTVLQEDSKSQFLDILLFRASLNPLHLQNSRVNNKWMWFDVPLKFKSRDYKNFLDVGAFDGDTIKAARSFFPLDRVHAVEANLEFVNKIAQQAKDFLNGLVIYPYAAWSSDCMLSFLEDHNGMFSVVQEESGSVCAAKLDSIINENVDLIKLDIEGSEAEALSGCTKLLSSAPDVLIAAYHRPSDLVDIVSTLLAQNPKYKVYFRHYSDVYDDSILYFIS